MYPTGGAWALGVGLDLRSHSRRCFRMALMTSRSSMKLMICMIPRHFGQVRGSTFPDQVGDRLRSSESAGPSLSGIPSNFYRLPGCRGPGRLQVRLSGYVGQQGGVSSFSLEMPWRHHPRQEPYEVILHVRIRAGGAGQLASLPRPPPFGFCEFFDTRQEFLYNPSARK